VCCRPTNAWLLSKFRGIVCGLLVLVLGPLHFYHYLGGGGRQPPLDHVNPRIRSSPITQHRRTFPQWVRFKILYPLTCQHFLHTADSPCYYEVFFMYIKTFPLIGYSCCDMLYKFPWGLYGKHIHSYSAYSSWLLDYVRNYHWYPILSTMRRAGCFPTHRWTKTGLPQSELIEMITTRTVNWLVVLQ
jgi:hypothetical protein